jgi:hypothetical protein
MIGKLRRVPLREVWRHETLDFTRWLEENIDVVNDVTGLYLTSVQREQAAGTFSVDLVAEDESGDLVIIENQLEKSDHGHLGQLITYLTAFEAKTAIWIVSEPRPEHTAAITWLNQTTPASFYLLKVEAVRIGESPPAPLFTLIVGPSEEGRQVGQTKVEWAKYQEQLERFWAQLLDKAGTRTDLFADMPPTKGNWLAKRLGTSGLYLAFVVSANGGRVELYVDYNETETNKRVFDQLHEAREEIGHRLGEMLTWDRRDGGVISKIEWHLPVKGYKHEASWPETQETMIDAMIRFEAALRPQLEQVRI